MDRGQAHTLEAFVAAMLLIGALFFALQATAVTPLSASTSSQHIENQQRTVANDLLGSAHRNGDLEATILYWNPDEERFNGSGDLERYSAGLPESLAFGESLEAAFGSRRVAYNLDVAYHRPGGGMRSKRVVYMGSPSDNAVSATRTVTLMDDATLTPPAFEDRTIGETNSSFYAPDIDDGPLYNVVEVRLVVWRM